MRNSTPTVVYNDDAKGRTLVRVRRGLTSAETLKLHGGSLGFCELCWRQTEYVEHQPKEYWKRGNGAIEEVTQIFPSDNSAYIAERVLDVFKLALDGKYSEVCALLEIAKQIPIDASNDDEFTQAGYIAAQIMMMMDIGKFTRLRAKFSHLCALPYGQICTKDIELHDELRVEILALIEDGIISMMQKRSDLIDRPQNRPSERFCKLHNQYRSDNARRLYKRDHAMRDQFERQISDLKSYYLREKWLIFRSNDIDAITRLRKEAYEKV